MADISIKREDGFLRAGGINLYYVRFGKGNRYRMLMLHGGPGFSHDYLLSFAHLAEKDFDIVLYDQFGCGRSDYPGSEENYTLEYAVEEVEGVRSAVFGSEKIHLFGNSWGGMLSLAYAVKYQNNLKSVISCSGLSSIPQAVSEMKRLISLLPAKYRDYIERNEASGNYESEEYREGVEYFYRQHLFRSDVWPEELTKAAELADRRGTYLKMNGPSEFTITGSIRNIDFTKQLRKITVPALITCGRYDEVTPVIAETIHDRIKGSEMVVFQESSHLQFLEEHEKYLDLIERFVSAHD